MPSSYQKWGLAARTPINRQGWWKGEPASFQRPATSWEGELLSRGFLPATDSQKKSFYKGRWGEATCRNSTLISGSRLEVGHQLSGHHRVGGFQYS